MSSIFRINRILFALGALLIALLALLFFSKTAAQKPATSDWRENWAVAEGFSLSIDTEGYEFPTSIAFVPKPGAGPKDPLYFVAELRGRIKVITNDRSVYTFAENFFQRKPEKELPEAEGETGLAGICVAPETGQVFATFAYQDAEGILHNNIIRFQSAPQTFSLEPSGQVAFTDIFDDYEAAISHQIGSCQVSGGSLYVSVGDGRQTEESQEVESLLGKVLRLTLDGQPAPGNPFYQAGDANSPAAYVWAIGFRNPFGLKVAKEGIFVADNGSDIDRFLQIEAGENYLWDGSDWSIGARANIAFAPDIGPAQLEYYSGGIAALPESYDRNFFLAASDPDVTGVLNFEYNPDEKKALSAPDYILKYQGDTRQVVVGVAVGPDGLYFAPTLPDAEGRSAVYRIFHDPGQQHPFLITQIDDPESLLVAKGCYGCHQIDGEGGTAGPALDQSAMIQRLEEQLNSAEYAKTLAEIDRLDREPFIRYKEARSEVLAAQGQERLRTWMIYHILEPRFDNPNSQMPNLGLSQTEAIAITDYLLEKKSLLERGEEKILSSLPAVLKPRHLFFAFSAGLIAGSMLLGLAVVFFPRSRSRKLTSEDRR